MAVDSPTLMITGMVITKTSVSLTEIAIVSFTASSSPKGFILSNDLK